MPRAVQKTAIPGFPIPFAGLAAAFAMVLLTGGCASGSGGGRPVAGTAATAGTGAPGASINGYKRQVKDGQELYCREDDVLGSRVKGRLICYTAIELAERQQTADELLRQARGAVGETVTPRMDNPRF